MKLSLVVATAGKSLGQVIPITLAQFLIGRDPECNLRPASALISKRHCAVLVKAGQVSVRDFDSTNGTFINDQPVKGEMALHNDDVLKAGPLSFKVVIEETASISKPTPPPKTSSGAADDENAAAMLLGLGDDSGPGATGAADSDSGVPSGSTVFDIPNPVTGAAEPSSESGMKKPETKKPDAKAAASASKAAESLLAKYSRRQR